MNGKVLAMAVLTGMALPPAAAALRPGDVVSGFTVRSVTELPEVKGRLVRMAYEKNGADLAWLDRDDDNMTFAIGFRTFPQDDTGVAHIIEHSVLCGSEKYPVKEPFVDLLKSSFATFLNAWTSADSTMYPVCSRNGADFLNLVDVYMDSVLHPLSVKDPFAFEQEGWHYELDAADGELRRNGVVYSEMKGAFANPERRLYHELRRLLYPQTCYGFVSGGDPAAIPRLTFEAYTAFYRKFYHPSNARIFLDGRVDLAAVLAKLDGFLAPYPRAEVDAAVAYQPPVAAAKTVEYEIGADETPDGKVILGDAWVFGRFDEREKLMALDVITDALAGDNDAPLKKALLDRGLCEDVRFGVGSAAQLEASLVVKNVKRENVAAVRRTVRETLAALVAKGLDRARLEALLDRAEFHDREKDYGGFPRGLAFFNDAYDQWLYGGDPADAFRNAARFASLRRRLAEGWFERMLKEAIVENPHHAELTMLPSATLGAARRAAERAALAKVKAGWTKAEAEAVVAACRAREKRQAAPDRPEDAAKLPVLAVKDVPVEGPVPVYETAQAGEVTVIRPRTQANGVLHLGLAFSVADLTVDELADLPMLARVLGDLPTARHAIAALRNELDGKLGNFGMSAAVYGKPGDPQDAHPYFSVGVSALLSRQADVRRLVPEVLLETSFADARAIGDLVKQTRIAAERATMGLGGRNHPFRRAAAQLSVRAALEETLEGFAQIRHLQKLDAGGAAALGARLAALARKVFVRDRLVVCLTDNMPASFAGELAAAFPRGPVGAPVAHAPFPKRREGFRIPASIGFAARVAHPVPGVYGGSAVVACRILSLGYLWNEIRVKGGAYGGNVRVRPDGDAGWLSWNDPTPVRSLDVYAKSGDALRAFAAGDDALDRYVVSAVAATEPYLTPRVEASRAMDLYLSGRTPADLQRLRAEMLATTKQDLAAFAKRLDALARDAAVCVLAGPQQLEACTNRLDAVESVVQTRE